MAIFDIDETINDPWAGLRDTEAYVDYVLEEAQRLFDNGEIKVTPNNLYFDYMLFGDLSDLKLPNCFQFDGREFTYMYCFNRFVVFCKGWKEAKVFYIWNGKIERWKSRWCSLSDFVKK